MASDAFKSWWGNFKQSGDICPLKLGVTREEVRRALGEPDATGGTSRKQRVPLIWKYQDVEFHFDPKNGDGLSLIYMEDAQGVPCLVVGLLP